MTIDLLGPGAAGAARALPATDPTVTANCSAPFATDTFFGNCVGGVPGTGTPIEAEELNWILQQLRRPMRLSGIPLANGNDDLLGQAIQSGAQNWTTFGGTANALTATLSPVSPALTPGMIVAGIPPANNTGPTTLNVDGHGNIACKLSDGTSFVGGELSSVGVAMFQYTGASWRLISTPPTGFLTGRWINTQFFYSSGTYTQTPGAVTALATALGGGGGSGGTQVTSSSTVAIGGSGCAGTLTLARVSVASIAGAAITIGAGGAAGAAGAGGNGGAGGTTSIGAGITAPGGPGGLAGPASAAWIQTPVGGSAGIGGNILSTPGMPGNCGQAVSASGFCFNGSGGSSPYGAGGAAQQGGGVGVNGSGYGAGASGPCNLLSGQAAQTGNAGSPGLVRIDEYA